MSYVSDTGLQILVRFPTGNVYDTTSMQKFVFHTAIDMRPAGYIRIADYESTQMSISSGDFITIVFSNTSENNVDRKAATFTAVIDSISVAKTDGPNTMYDISFSMGNINQLVKKSIAYKGTSIKALMSAMDSYKQKYQVVSGLDTSDAMTWRLVGDDLWAQLDNISSKSFKSNDFVFWGWDIVNDCIRVSSLQAENGVTVNQFVIPSDDAITDTAHAIDYSTTSALTLYKYISGVERRGNNLGKNRDKLFPNVAFSGVRDGKLQECQVKGRCFDDMLSGMGDNTRASVIASSGLADGKVAYGDLTVLRQWPNNVHNNYSSAPIYRNYRMSTFAKTLSVQLYNNVGPVIGTRIGAAVMKLGAKSKRESTLDPLYTDSYVVWGKTIMVDPMITTKHARRVNGGNPITVTLDLRSDRQGPDDAYVNEINKKVFG